MSDKLFFPLAFLLAAFCVFLALNPYADRPPRGPVSGGGRNAEDVTVSGAELHRFVAGATGGLDIETPKGGGPTILHISRLAEQVYDNPLSGPHLVLAEDLEYAFENRPVEVVIEARSAGDFAATAFEADYLAKPGVESGWKSFTLTREFAPYSFQYTPPTRGTSDGYDYIGIRPFVPDKHRTMEIRSVRIHVLGPKGATLGKPAPQPASSIP